MELPDFMNYGNKFSKQDFVEKIARIARGLVLNWFILP